MKLQLLIIFTLIFAPGFDKSAADDSSVQSFDQSCREFKELMVSGNKLMFLRTNLAASDPTWKAVICLHCTEARESGLLKVTSLKDKSVEWHYKDKDFLALNEILVGEDDLKKEKLGMHSILASVRKTCRSVLEPVNEGSHLELQGNDKCVRHEYLRQYLKRKFSLNEISYTKLESKKNLPEQEFFQGCHQLLQQSADSNVVNKAWSSIYLAVKHFLGGGLGEYDPVVSNDSKSFQREIATESIGKKSK